ncbi:MAG TPA: hypothetical protein VF599_02620 [Pyrinomonadaceae bacterium]
MSHIDLQNILVMVGCDRKGGNFKLSSYVVSDKLVFLIYLVFVISDILMKNKENLSKTGEITEQTVVNSVVG